MRCDFVVSAMAKKAKISPSKKSAKKSAPSKSKKSAKKAVKKSIKKSTKKSVKKSVKKVIKKAPARKAPAKVAPAKKAPAVSAPSRTTAVPTPVAPQAPAVSYPDQIADRSVRLTDGSTSSLSGLSGPKGLVLYFYPKDDTPGCTVEACNFRDAESKIRAMGYKIAGVSPDTSTAHQKFTAKYHLNFPLIADEDHSLCEAAGVWQEKSMYGKSYMGVARTTLVLDPSLNVKKVYEKVKPDGHADAIAGDLSGL